MTASSYASPYRLALGLLEVGSGLCVKHLLIKVLKGAVAARHDIGHISPFDLADRRLGDAGLFAYLRLREVALLERQNIVLCFHCHIPLRLS